MAIAVQQPIYSNGSALPSKGGMLPASWEHSQPPVPWKKYFIYDFNSDLAISHTIKWSVNS